jgi:hypothetical protein
LLQIMIQISIGPTLFFWCEMSLEFAIGSWSDPNFFYCKH